MRIRFWNTFLTSIAVVAVAFSLVGCKDDGPSSQTYVRSGPDKPLRIAVLDFTNLAPRSDEAGRVVTNSVVTYLLSTGAVDVVEPGVVDQVMRENRILPPPSGLDAKSAQQLGESLGVDAILTGIVEEYGEVRIGNEVYPSVSFSARLISARDATIVWAGMVSRTGADKVLLFDIRRISSMGKLVKSAVEGLASSMRRDQSRIVAQLRPSASVGMSMAPAHGSGSSTPPPLPPGASLSDVSAPPSVKTVTPASASAAGKSGDESKAYTEQDLLALLPDVPGYTKSSVAYTKHYHDTLTAKYQIGGGQQFVDVKLVDYLKLAQTQKFMQTEHSGQTVGEFGGLPAFTGTSEFKYVHIDVAVGRFGLFVSGPEAKKSDVGKLAEALVEALK